MDDPSFLPVEILIGHIVNRLEFKDFYSCTLTCSSWREMIFCSTRLDFDYVLTPQRMSEASDTYMDHVFQHLQNYPHLRDLTFTMQPKLHSTLFYRLGVQSLPSLRSLRILNCNKTKMREAPVGKSFDYASWFPELKELELEGCEVPLACISPHLIPPTLTHLSFAGSTKLNDDCLVNLSVWIKQLKHLNVHGVYRLTNRGLKAICSSNPNLSYLEISSLMNLDDQVLEDIMKSCPRMETFIARKSKFPDHAISLIPKYWGSTLKEIDLKLCVNSYTGAGIEGIIPGLPSLTKLDIQKCFMLTDTSPLLRLLSEHCPMLRILDIRDCNEFQMDGLQEFMEKCSKLSRLYLRSPTIMDAHLEIISEHVPQNTELKHIFLQSCNSITHIGIEYLMRSKKLKCLKEILATDIVPSLNQEYLIQVQKECPQILLHHLPSSNLRIRKPKAVPSSNPESIENEEIRTLGEVDEEIDV